MTDLETTAPRRGQVLRRAVRWASEPAGLAGGFLGAALVALSPGGLGLVGLVLGWAYGIVVGALVRLFRIPPAVYPLAGLLAGPLPIALLLPPSASSADRGLLGVGLLLGLVIGTVEWAVARRAAGLEPEA